jgi:protein-ribulosamine 3-kinase
MVYLCEEYAPCEGIDAYDPQLDPSVTGAQIISHQDVEMN